MEEQGAPWLRHPLDNGAGWVSRALFGWVGPLVQLAGDSRKLGVSDVWPLPENARLAALQAALHRAHAGAQAALLHPRPDLLGVLLSFQRPGLIASGLARLGADLCAVSAPLVLSQLIMFVEGSGGGEVGAGLPLWQGLGLATALAALGAAQALLLNQVVPQP
mmetsp:Transcript_68969/g.218117  ORF Transcript_68969/g.218117 Transcript_68969/m.218117 type:complete len:163 (-) Transcript_68969:90-578(-)